MDYLWIAIPVLLIAALIAALVLRSPKREPLITGEREQAVALARIAPDVPDAQDVEEDEVFVSIALLPEATALDEARLSEISDSTVIARISQAVPAMAQTATRTAANTALKNQELYKAILPAGMTLAKSRTMEGAYRGFARGGTAANSPFRANANLVKVDVSKTTAVASGVANVMNVGSLVVGQYYMSEINNRLETLTKSVDRIGNFQDREFKSRIVSLIAHVGEISQFSSEIMEDDTQRHIKMQTLDHLRITATDLLGQVIITIDGITSANPSPDYKEYEDRVSELAMLLGYQNALIVVLEEISDLTYLLGRGSVSSESSHSILKKYVEQSEQARVRLRAWHDRQVERLKIDLTQERRSRLGWDAFLAAVPSMVDEKFKYRALEQGVVREIGTQASTALACRGDLHDVYDEDVEIIIKDGKYFYLHEAPADYGDVPKTP
ncbi:MAG: topoisomerase IV [Myxococcota bacterium]|nr:topoisomerase IV [Myxococcota bacterium]